MINMPAVNSIRRQRREGLGVSDIPRMSGVSRDTACKYLGRDDFSPAPPARKSGPSRLGPYKPVIGQWMRDDAGSWRKQRHTAGRIWRRPVDECGADVSETTAGRYVAKQKGRNASRKDRYLDLVWEPGRAWADFGEADFYVSGVRTRLSFFVLTFPYSNVGPAQVFPGENAECACWALRQIFDHVGGIPTGIVFDNAAGAGTRGVRLRPHHRPLRQVRRPLRLRLRVLQPELRPREGICGEQGGGAQTQPAAPTSPS